MAREQVGRIRGLSKKARQELIVALAAEISEKYVGTRHRGECRNEIVKLVSESIEEELAAFTAELRTNVGID